MGPQIRTGALDAAGGIVDLAAACRASLLGEGLAPGRGRAHQRGAAARRHGGVDRRRRTLARRRAPGAAVGGRRGARRGRRGQSCTRRRHCISCRRCPGRRCCATSWASRRTCATSTRSWGARSRPSGTSIPVYYKGNPGSLGTHGDDIPIPSYATALDIEFELAMVIGRGGINIPAERALDHVFGYMIYNDFSERTIQAREMSVGLGPAKGKDFVRGHVLGPYLVTADEVPDIYNLRMVARVNGEVWCETNSGTIHWKFEQMIAHVSTDELLRPGRDPRLGNGRRRIGRRAGHASRPRRRRRARGRAPWHLEEPSHLNADRHDQSRDRGNAADVRCADRRAARRQDRARGADVSGLPPYSARRARGLAAACGRDPRERSRRRSAA